MTWTWLDDDFTDRPNILPLSDAAFRLNIEGLVYCNRNGLDGALPRIALPRLGRPAQETIAELMAAGLWEPVAGGWQLDWSDQESAADVEGRRAKWRERTERHRLHNKGDHSKCDPERCWVLRGDTSVTRDVTRESQRESRPSHSPSHSHSPSLQEGGMGEGLESDALGRTDTSPEEQPPSGPDPDQTLVTSKIHYVGDCEHMTGGRNTGRLTGKMTCKKCQEAKERKEELEERRRWEKEQRPAEEDERQRRALRVVDTADDEPTDDEETP